MESNVWSDKEIKSILKDDVILVSLHVDATKKLPIERGMKLLWLVGLRK